MFHFEWSTPNAVSAHVAFYKWFLNFLLISSGHSYFNHNTLKCSVPPFTPTLHKEITNWGLEERGAS